MSGAIAGSSRKSVLVADSDRHAGRAVVAALAADGCPTALATSADEVRRALSENPYDVLLVDAQVAPPADGELLGWVRRQRPDTILLVMSQAPTVPEAVAALQAGADDYLGKPVAAATLHDRLAAPRAAGALGQYNEMPIRKLEQELAQLEAVNRELERDLAQRQEALAALAEAERFARSTIDALPIRLCVLDGSGRIIAVNQAWREFAALGPPTVVTGAEGSDFVAACRADGDPASTALVRGVRAVLDGDQADYADEWECPLPTGPEWFVRRAARLAGDPPVRVMVTFQNTSLRVRAEAKRARLAAEVRQQQRLESIGTLAAGVAHEISNPIQGLADCAEQIRALAPPTSELAENAALILQEADRVATIVRNLLRFARQDRYDGARLVCARPADVVADALSLIRAVLRHDQVDLQTEVPADLPLLRCHSQQVQQVLVNLLTNARDALNEKYPDRHPEKCIRLTGRAFEQDGRRWLRLTVEDHGPGINEDVGARIMDPFYTTKPEAKGTGLGLSISHGIVSDHHGRLWYETELGQWTRFHLDLPADDTEPGPASSSAVQDQRAGITQSAG